MRQRFALTIDKGDLITKRFNAQQCDFIKYFEQNIRIIETYSAIMITLNDICLINKQIEDLKPSFSYLDRVIFLTATFSICICRHINQVN